MNSTVSFFSQFSIVKINYFPLSAHTLGNAAVLLCGRFILLCPAHSEFPTYKKMTQNSPLGEQNRKGKYILKRCSFLVLQNCFSPSLLLYYIIKGQYAFLRREWFIYPNRLCCPGFNSPWFWQAPGILLTLLDALDKCLGKVFVQVKHVWFVARHFHLK